MQREAADAINQTPASASSIAAARCARALEAARLVLPRPRQSDFARRFDRSGAWLHDRLAELYGASAAFDDWFVQLVRAVATTHADRHDELVALDTRRESARDWFLSEQMIGYSAYVDRFAGNLRGVIGRIGYLRELNVRYLHLLPFLRARAGDNDGGFAVSDFDSVDPRFGDNADLEALTCALRAESISLASCFVLNHVANDHPWALAAARGDATRRDFFHIFTNPAERDRYAPYLAEVFPQAAPGNFTYVAAVGGWVWTTFYPYQWDLNYANRAVFAEMALTMLRLANRGIEVFRLDSTAYLWKRAGTNCMNQPEAHTILQALRAIADLAAPGVLLKAEAIVPTRQLPPYFGLSDALGRECHLAYHSSLMAAAWAALSEQDADLVRRVTDETPALAAHASWATYVRCHDDIGWTVLRSEAADDDMTATRRLSRVVRFFAGDVDGSFARGASFQAPSEGAVHGSNGMAAALVGFEQARTADERAAAANRLSLLYALALSFGGLPIIFMGDELAQGNDYPQSPTAEQQSDGRWLQRPYLDERRLAQRHDVSTDAGRTFTTLQRLCDVRARRPALAANVPRRLLICNARAVLAYARGADSIALFNFSDQAQPATLTVHPHAIDLCGTWRDAIEKIDIVSDDPASMLVAIDAWSFRWLERRR